jgi:hypothetical protein
MKNILAIALLLLCMACGKSYEVRSIRATHNYMGVPRERANDQVLVRVDVRNGDICAVGGDTAYYMDSQGFITSAIKACQQH